MQTRIREMEKGDAEQLLSVYRRFAKEYVGLASRDLNAYKRLLRKKENMGWVALDEKGDVIGYVTARFDRKSREARIREIVVDASEDFEKIAKPLVDKAYHTLLEKKPAVISAGSIRNPSFAKIFPELGFLEVESTGVFMYAILEASGFLKEILPVLEKRLKQLESWEGLLQVECEEHSVFIKKQPEKMETFIWTNQRPDLRITLSRESLTKLLFGVEDLVESLKKGRLNVETTLNEGEVSQVLAALFPGHQFLIMDFW